ncbi:hypothetical protein V8E55_012083 [Tylopilus felleus]
MATANTALPPMGKISIIGIWVETVLYGICVMYGLCMFVLLREGKVPTLRLVLIVMASILFLLCTVHVGASLQQLLDAFIYAPADVPDYSTTYWLNFDSTPRVLKDNLYVTLIWRLYVVFMCDWKVVVFPIILAACCMGCGYAASAVPAPPNGGLYGSISTSLLISACAFGVTLNVSVMLAIVTRLRWMGRTISALTNFSSNRYAASIYIVIQSGCIYVICGVVVLALFTSNSPAALTVLDVIAQLAVCVH